MRNLFVPQLQSDERNSKNHWFLAAFFPPFLPLLEEMGPPEAQSREGGVEPHPYGGIDESAPVFEGAPMRAVGDAVPYGRIRQGAAENAAQAISAHTADRPVHRLGREVIVCGDPWRQR